MEYFDVLDERGQYTGKIETRGECHEKGLFHKAVALFIINSRNQVLLQKRSSSKRAWPNCWDISAGGHVLAGEFGFEAVIRECEEELGLLIQEKDPLFIGAVTSCTTTPHDIHNHYNEFYIVRKDLEVDSLKLQTSEVSDVCWFERADIVQKIQQHDPKLTEKEGCWEYLLKYYEWLDKK